jgi:hypothetical protein
MRKFPNTPKKGDRLLRSSDDWLMTAMFAPDPGLREVCLWGGYMKAGAALINEAQRQPLHRNLLLYPILFVYRHGLETAMKRIIELYGSLGNVERDERGEHDLLASWRKCRTIFESVPELDGDEEIEAVEQIVKDFHDIDKNATSFRYSKNQNGAMIKAFPMASWRRSTAMSRPPSARPRATEPNETSKPSSTSSPVTCSLIHPSKCTPKA